jgi:hypothetical protein
MSVSGKTSLMIILAAGGLGFFVALAGSPGIGSVRAAEGEVVYVSLVEVNQQAEAPE